MFRSQLTSGLLLGFLVASSLLAAEPAKIETVAGTGKTGPARAGDGGKATEAVLNQPFFCDLDRAGSLYIAEAGTHSIRKLDLRTGMISTVAGTGTKGYSGDGGPALKATLHDPSTLVCGDNGDLYIVDRLNLVIRKVDGKTNVITTVAGTGNKGFSGDGGMAAVATFVEPHDCCLDGQGGLLIADVGDWRIRRLDLKTGMISTIAGIGRTKAKGKIDPKEKGDGGPAAKALIPGARAVCVDSAGNIFVCERQGHSIRKIDKAGVITTIAGTGAAGYAGDGGDALKAAFKAPKGIRCDAQGNIYLIDTENHAIRRIDAKTGVISTVAGGRKGSEGDGGDATQAGLNRPHGCVIDESGALWIADTDNHRIRKVAAPK